MWAGRAVTAGNVEIVPFPSPSLSCYLTRSCWNYSLKMCLRNSLFLFNLNETKPLKSQCKEEPCIIRAKTSVPLKDLQLKVPCCILPLTQFCLYNGSSNLMLKGTCGWERKPGCFILSDSFRFSIFSPSQSCGQVTRLGRPKGWPSLEALYAYNHPCFFCHGLFAFSWSSFPLSPIFLYVPYIHLHCVFFILLCMMPFKLGTVPPISIVSASLPPASLSTFSYGAS